MTWIIAEDEVPQLLGLPAGDRAVSFFQLIGDWEEAWGLTDDDGWVVARETDVLPLWPHAVFAEACARGPWEGALPGAVSIDDLLVDLLPMLASENLRIAVFPSPEDPGLILTPA